VSGGIPRGWVFSAFGYAFPILTIPGIAGISHVLTAVNANVGPTSAITYYSLYVSVGSLNVELGLIIPGVASSGVEGSPGSEDWSGELMAPAGSALSVQFTLVAGGGSSQPYTTIDIAGYDI
jgi:hypothetical protein